MNETLKMHGGKILFGGVLVLCGIYVAVTTSESEDEKLKGLEENQRKIDTALKSTATPAGYKYSSAGLKLSDAFARNQDRIKDNIDEVGKRVAYPKPKAPQIDPSTLPHPADERHVKVLALAPGEALPKNANGNVYYTVANPTEVSAKADHGKVFITFKVPETATIDRKILTDDKNPGSAVSRDFPVITVVRAEIFKGLAADKIDTKAPFATIDFGSEEAVRDLYPQEEAEKKDEKKTDESSGSIRRAERAENKEVKKEEKEAAKPEEVPAEFAGVRVFEDTHVDPQTAYFYKVRLISRMDPPPEIWFPEPDGKGGILRRTIFHAPKNAETVIPAQANSKARLFASPWIDAVSAVTPAEYKFRFEGTEGEFSEPETPVHLVRQDYKGIFDTQVWVNEAQEWRNIRLIVAKGERLKDTVKGAKKPKAYDFDTHRQLEEILWRTEKVEKETEELVLDKDGNPMKDPEDDKKMLKQKKKITTDSLPFKVAVLKDLATGKLEEYRVSHDKEKQDLAIEIYKKMADKQKKEEEKRKEEIKKIVERNKREAEKHKAPPAMTDEWGPMGMGPMGGMGPGPGGGPSGGGGPRGGGGYGDENANGLPPGPGPRR